MHSSDVLSLLVFFFAKSQLVGVGGSVERDQSVPAQTAPQQQARFGSDWTSVSFPWKTKNKRHALRARAPVKHDYYITGQSGMPAQQQQYDSTAGAGRPAPQQPPIIGCGLPGPYGGGTVVFTGKLVCRYLYIAECRPSPLRKPTAHGSGFERQCKPEACPPRRTERHPPFTKHAAIVTSCRVQVVVDQ